VLNEHLQVLTLVVLDGVVESGWVALDINNPFLFIRCRCTPFLLLALLYNFVSKSYLIVETTSMHLASRPFFDYDILTSLLVNLKLLKK
jgi:hypothetical protein